MPEGPEVRKYADLLASNLAGKRIIEFSARTKNAKAWLAEHEPELLGKRIERIFAHGKNVIGIIEGGFFFYSHQMMWGRWEVHRNPDPATGELPQRDRRERARIIVDGAIALLMSAPVLEIGKGDPYDEIGFLRNLGPSALPYAPDTFDTVEFLKRLKRPKNKARTIGDALLDQTIVAGLGNYLRAEIMFIAKLDPWRKVSSLNPFELETLARLVPKITQASYEKGYTVTLPHRKRMAGDKTLVYVPGKEYGTRHYVFRRTNLPCLICGQPIKQQRQPVTNLAAVDEEGEERTRIVYFCPRCQNVPSAVYDKPTKKRA
jgi:formamidopyrimidine-DNA glycosylase